VLEDMLLELRSPDTDQRTRNRIRRDLHPYIKLMFEAGGFIKQRAQVHIDGPQLIEGIIGFDAARWAEETANGELSTSAPEPAPAPKPEPESAPGPVAASVPDGPAGGAGVCSCGAEAACRVWDYE